MNLSEAKKEFKNGKKITHKLFFDDEFIVLVDGKMKDEGGITLDSKYFWGERQSIEWQSGWELF